MDAMSALQSTDTACCESENRRARLDLDVAQRVAGRPAGHADVVGDQVAACALQEHVAGGGGGRVRDDAAVARRLRGHVARLVARQQRGALLPRRPRFGRACSHVLRSAARRGSTAVMVGMRQRRPC